MCNTYYQQPTMVVVDPIGSLAEAGNRRDASLMLIRLIDFLKLRGITAFFTNLTSGGEAIEKTDVHVSSLVDAWLPPAQSGTWRAERVANRDKLGKDTGIKLGQRSA